MDSGVLNLRAKTSTLGFLFRMLSGVGLIKSEATPVHRLSIILIQGLPCFSDWTSSGFIHKEEFDAVSCCQRIFFEDVRLHRSVPSRRGLASSNSDIHTVFSLPPVIMEFGFTFSLAPF
jgi:hypothetical protein